LKATETVVTQHVRACPEHAEGDERQDEIEETIAADSLTPRGLLIDDGEFGGEKDSRQYDAMLLRETGDGIQRRDCRCRPRPQRPGHAVTKVEEHRRNEHERDQELRLTDDVRDRFDMDRMNSEARRNDERRPRRENSARQQKYENRHHSVQDDVDGMEQHRTTAAGDILNIE
jgi:hypothetical protein